MAKHLYAGGAEGLLDGTIRLYSDTIKVALIRGYTLDSADRTLGDIVTAGGTVISRSPALTGHTFTDGTWRHASSNLGSPTDPTAATARVAFKDTGVDATSRLILWDDEGAGLPLSPNGTQIDLTPNAAGYLTISSAV